MRIVAQSATLWAVGRAKKLENSKGLRLGDNAHAFTGGLRLWEDEKKEEQTKGSKKKQLSRGKTLTQSRLRHTNNIL